MIDFLDRENEIPTRQDVIDYLEQRRDVTAALDVTSAAEYVQESPIELLTRLLRSDTRDLPRPRFLDPITLEFLNANEERIRRADLWEGAVLIQERQQSLDAQGYEPAGDGSRRGRPPLGRTSSVEHQEARELLQPRQLEQRAQAASGAKSKAKRNRT